MGGERMNIFEKLIQIPFCDSLGLTGMTDEFFCVSVYEHFIQNKRSFLIVTPTLYEANQLYDSLTSYTKDVLLFPMDDFLTSEAVAVSPDLMVTRLETLNSLIEFTPKIVITHLMGYLRFLPTPIVYQKNMLHFSKGDEIEPKQLAEFFFRLGYCRETLVTKTGEVGVRGFVIDVFPIGENHPVRFEFFGDTIDSIRYFDEETQKSLSEMEEISIYPYREFLLEHYPEDIVCYQQKYLPTYSSSVSHILDYLDHPIVIYKDPSQLKQSYFTLLDTVFEYQSNKDSQFHDSYFYAFEKIHPKCLVYYYALDNLTKDKNITMMHYDVKNIIPFQENISLINKYLIEQLSLKKTVIIALKEYQSKNLKKYLTVPFLTTTEDKIEEGCINLIYKDMSQGFAYLNYVFLTEKELFRTRIKKQYHTKFKYASKIRDINKLNIGDYVVHDIHGIGVYHGIRSLTQMGVQKDYVELLYQGNDKLYIPVEKIDLISKYSGKEGSTPKINKLGGTEWKKTKLRVRNKIHDIANQLLRIYAEREIKKGFAFSKDGELQKQFEDSFPYEATKDQLIASEQIKEDMESSRPMDRLLCGDVGYGKTEVAFRAVFKAVMDSKQVLYLCPTTILSSQQYESARERFQHFPVRIALLNRFTSSSDAKRIIAGLKDGTIDFLIGTHRLLSEDVQPKDLGLLIIDEEQRFGVTHKEKIKRYKSNVDVLTLTATPIPRTLQMSMVGIRSLSLIQTPPVDRYPVQTYVIEENPQIIRDAIYKEVSRGGQVFLLYNRVESIERKVQEISSIVPDVRIISAHGQLPKMELENRMMKFIQHEYDVLICTTIIETGIDISNTNTLIILDADRFGLSQLYQIRGRVGRSNKIAYAYLMYQSGKMLNETSIKRLNVIKEFTELGSGFSIATRDLSIRGAGDILGSEQAGFIDTVGIDLYLKMLNDEVAHLKGETTIEEEIQDEKPYLNVSTHIEDSYVDDTDLKIEIHKKINQIDSYSKLLEIKEELEDRFGRINDDMIIYMYQEWFEKLAKKLDIIRVQETRNSIELTFSEDASKRLDAEALFIASTKITSMFRFRMQGNCFSIILDTIKLEKHYIFYLIELLETIE